MKTEIIDEFASLNTIKRDASMPRSATHAICLLRMDSIGDCVVLFSGSLAQMDRKFRRLHGCLAEIREISDEITLTRVL